jgi:hypothetical protein
MILGFMKKESESPKEGRAKHPALRRLRQEDAGVITIGKGRGPEFFSKVQQSLNVQLEDKELDISVPSAHSVARVEDRKEGILNNVTVNVEVKESGCRCVIL